MSASNAVQCASVFILSSILLGACPGAARSDEGRSFLSLRQKGELIWNGEVHDGQGRGYEMLVVPGYVPPARSITQGWVKGADRLCDYGRSKPYVGIWNGWKQSGRGYRMVFVDFIGHGTRNAWAQNFEMASQARSRGAFAWYLAYPYAFVKSSVSSVFYVTGGAVAAAGVTVYGAALRPACELVMPVTGGLWNVGIKGTALPIVRMGWNTIVTPPLSLFEFEPTPGSADGFWVRQTYASRTQTPSEAL